MKIRTLEDLVQAVDQDLAWRKKEISVFSRVVVKANGAAIDSTVRAGVALVYAHWEGFVKHAAESYVRFVALRRLGSNQLATPFVGQAVRKAFSKLSGSHSAEAINEMVDAVFRSSGQPCPIPTKDEVNTRSNLSSDVLKDIVASLGLEYELFKSKENLLDEKLLGQRNKIAHGKYLDVSRDHFLDLKSNVVVLMDQFRSEIENAAAAGKYRLADV